MKQHHVFTKVAIIIGIFMVFAGCSLGAGDSSGEELPPVEEINFLVNPGFEDGSDPDGPVKWRAHSDPEFSPVVPEAARTGDLGLKIVSPQSDPEDPNSWQRIVLEQGASDIVGGRTYEYSLWVKTEEAVGMVGLSMAVYFPGGKDRQQYHQWFDDGTFNTNGEWQQISMQTYVPEDARSIISYIRFEGPGIAYFDDASLRIID